MTFHIGEKVVYPNYGIGTIENISERILAGRRQRYYLLRIQHSQVSVIVPCCQARELGLRKVTGNGQITQMLEYLAHGQVNCCRDWKTRYKQNLEKMQRGTLLNIAEVLKTLLTVQQTKSLSFREKKLLQRAKQLLVAEVAIAKNISNQQAEDLIRQALRKASLELPDLY